MSMSANFLSLPNELRNEIYKQVLVLQEPIECWTRSWLSQSQLQALTPGLLRANKAVHLGASLMLYAQNRFSFAMCSSEEVASFLEQIGRKNASYILEICISFPKFQYLDLQDVTIEDDSIRILTKIQSDCTKLSTLTMSRRSTYALEARLDALDYPKIACKALALANTHFTAISSQPEIILQVYKNGPSDHMRRKMKSHGWTIDVTEEEWHSDWGFDDEEDDDYGFGAWNYDFGLGNYRLVYNDGHGDYAWDYDYGYGNDPWYDD